MFKEGTKYIFSLLPSSSKMCLLSYCRYRIKIIGDFMPMIKYNDNG